MANNGWAKKLAPWVTEFVVSLFRQLGRKKPEPQVEDPYEERRKAQVIRLKVIRKGKKVN